ncbi:hypothetical protein [Trichloromonas sp.]|uniref:hypothetical protein n=1 Tax=Trichloromonas sp. TaxID=3069249 RepID=UPI001DCC0128|nr:hypothetical protein [Desulfuromonadaceae bacterium]MDY0269072.1 hypothetical protein [Trichloromonas sp.]
MTSYDANHPIYDEATCTGERGSQEVAPAKYAAEQPEPQLSGQSQIPEGADPPLCGGCPDYCYLSAPDSDPENPPPGYAPCLHAYDNDPWLGLDTECDFDPEEDEMDLAMASEIAEREDFDWTHYL